MVRTLPEWFRASTGAATLKCCPDHATVISDMNLGRLIRKYNYIYRDGLVDYLTNFKFSVVKMISSCKLYRSTLAVAGSDHK